MVVKKPRTKAASPAAFEKLRAEAERLAAIHGMLSCPVRLMILSFIEDEGRTFTEIVQHLSGIGTTHQTVSYHLALLRIGGRVESTRRGKCTVYTIKPETLAVLRASRAALAN